MADLAKCETLLLEGCQRSAVFFRDKLKPTGRIHDATTWPEQLPGCPTSVSVSNTPLRSDSPHFRCKPMQGLVLSLRDTALKIVKIEISCRLSIVHINLPNRSPTPAVVPIAIAPQNVTLISPVITRAPSTRAARPPKKARKSRDAAETKTVI